MKRRQWHPDLKAKIVIQGIKGKPVAQICNEYEISQSLYYQWREQFYNNAKQIFEWSSYNRTIEKISRENQRLRNKISSGR